MIPVARRAVILPKSKKLLTSLESRLTGVGVGVVTVSFDVFERSFISGE